MPPGTEIGASSPEIGIEASAEDKELVKSVDDLITRIGRLNGVVAGSGKTANELFGSDRAKAADFGEIRKWMEKELPETIDPIIHRVERNEPLTEGERNVLTGSRTKFEEYRKMLEELCTANSIALPEETATSLPAEVSTPETDITPPPTVTAPEAGKKLTAEEIIALEAGKGILKDDVERETARMIAEAINDGKPISVPLVDGSLLIPYVEAKLSALGLDYTTEKGMKPGVVSGTEFLSFIIKGSAPTGEPAPPPAPTPGPVEPTPPIPVPPTPAPEPTPPGPTPMPTPTPGPGPSPTPPAPVSADDLRRMEREHDARSQEADRLIKTIEDGEIERKIQRAMDSKGFFGAIFGYRRERRKAEEGRGTILDEKEKELIRGLLEHRETVAQGLADTSVGGVRREVYKLMEAYGFKLDDNGNFVPPDKPNGLQQLISRIRPLAPIFGGAVLGGALRRGLTSLVGGVLGGFGVSAGAGFAVGGLMGWLRGKRQAHEALSSGEVWQRELKTAIDSGNIDSIKLACRKVEDLFGSTKAHEEFFNKRSGKEALLLVNLYEQGLQMVAVREAAVELAAVAEGEMSPEQRLALVAQKFGEVCSVASGGDFKIIENDPRYKELIEAGLTRGLGEIRSAEMGTRFNTELEARRKERKKIIAVAAIKGALIGGVAGGAGYLVGHYILGPAIERVFGHAGDQAANVHQGVEPGTAVPLPHEGTPVPHSVEEGAGDRWIHLTNRFTVPQQEFTEGHARAIGFGDFIDQHRNMIDLTHDGGQTYVQQDVGGMLREAARIAGHVGPGYEGSGASLVEWGNATPDQIHHFVNALNFVGKHHMEVNIGQEYPAISVGHLQEIYNQWQAAGGINGGDRIMIDGTALGIWNESAMQTADGVLKEGLKVGATGAAKRAASRIPGWLLLAGAGAAVVGGGVLGNWIDSKMKKAPEAKSFGTDVGRGDYRRIGAYGPSQTSTEQTTQTSERATEGPQDQTRTDGQGQTQREQPTLSTSQTGLRPEGKDPAEMTKEEAEAEKTAISTSITEKKGMMKLEEFMNRDQLGELEQEARRINETGADLNTKIRGIAEKISTLRGEYQIPADFRPDEPNRLQLWDWDQAENYLLYVRDINRLEKVNARIVELGIPAAPVATPDNDLTGKPPLGEMLKDIRTEQAEPKPAGGVKEPRPSKADRLANAPARAKGKEEENPKLAAARKEAEKNIPEYVTETRDRALLSELFARAITEGKIRHVFDGYNEERGIDLAGALNLMFQNAGYRFNEKGSKGLGWMGAEGGKKTATLEMLGIKPNTESKRRPLPVAEAGRAISVAGILALEKGRTLRGKIASEAAKQIYGMIQNGTPIAVREDKQSKLAFVRGKLEALRNLGVDSTERTEGGEVIFEIVKKTE